MNSLAKTYSDLGRHADALAMGERALELWRRVLPANHFNIGEGCAGCGATTSPSIGCDSSLRRSSLVQLVQLSDESRRIAPRRGVHA
jgi:hypothetical protein